MNTAFRDQPFASPERPPWRMSHRGADPWNGVQVCRYAGRLGHLTVRQRQTRPPYQIDTLRGRVEPWGDEDPI